VSVRHFDKGSGRPFHTLDISQGGSTVELFINDREVAERLADAASVILAKFPKPGGIPFATNFEVIDTDGNHSAWVVKCPDCGAYIEETEMKDEESHSGAEYAKHYTEVHGK
jgi:hypothetical protein